MTAVGQRNVEAVKKVLAELKIRILAEDTGLNFGRTVEFYPETGDYIIKSVGEVVDYLRSFSPVWRKLVNGEAQFIL